MQLWLDPCLMRLCLSQSQSPMQNTGTYGFAPCSDATFARSALICSWSASFMTL